MYQMIMLFSFLLVMKYFANTMIAGEETYEQDCLRVHLEKQMYQFSLNLRLCVCTHRIFPDSKCIFKREAIVLVTMISV